MTMCGWSSRRKCPRLVSVGGPMSRCAAKFSGRRPRQADCSGERRNHKAETASRIARVCRPRGCGRSLLGGFPLTGDFNGASGQSAKDMVRMISAAGKQRARRGVYQHGRLGDGGVARPASRCSSGARTPWAYSGQETMTPSARVTASISRETSGGVRSPSSSGLKIGKRPSPS